LKQREVYSTSLAIFN